MVGPTVRAAGRIMLQRPTGKLIFINIRDWTGDIQLFVGKKQVGEADFELAGQFDLGDIIGVDGQLGVHEHGRADDLCREAAFPVQVTSRRRRRSTTG